MTTTTSMSIVTRFIIGASLVLAVFVAVPAFAQASTYAYVHTTGEVRTVNADTSSTAIAVAPGISFHSGVILLSNPFDSVVGDMTSGI